MDRSNSEAGLEAGANSAMNATDFTDGIHETAKSRNEPADASVDTPALSSEGAVGSQFTTEGAVGSTAQSIGGPLDSAGSVGQHFTESGAVGGSVEEHMGKGT